MSRFLESIKAILPLKANKAGQVPKYFALQDEEKDTDEQHPTYKETELFPEDRFESLLANEEFGIVKSNALDVLNRDPWNSLALKRMGRISNGLESMLYYQDALKSDPGDLECLSLLLANEAEMFVEGTNGDSETLTRRLDRIFSFVGEGGIEKSSEVFSEVIEDAYLKEPYKTRGLVVSLFRVVSKYSGGVALSLFLSLRMNLIDERIRKSALTCSKREKRFSLSLSLVNRIEPEEEREFERMDVLRRISEVIFDGEMSEIAKMLVDSTGETESERFLNFLEDLSPFSEKISRVIVSDIVTNSLEIEDMVRILKRDLLEDFEEERIFNSSEVEIGELESDLINLPLFSLDYRIVYETSKAESIPELIGIIGAIISREELSERRKDEIVLSAVNSIRRFEPDHAIRLLESYGLRNDSDERIKRHAARTFESIGRLEEARVALDGASQSSSISLLKRIDEVSNWVKDGYELDIGGYVSDEFSPKPGKIMYCVHSSQPFVNSGYTIRTEEIVDSLKEKGFDIGVFCRWGFPTDRKDYNDGTIDSNKYKIRGIDHILDPDDEGMSGVKNEEYVHRAAESLLKSALIFRPSIMYAASDHSIGLAAAIVADILSIPFIYEMRGIWAYSRAANNSNFERSAKFQQMIRLERQCAEKADSLFVISDGLKQTVKQWGIDPSKIEIIPNGVSKFSNFSNNDDEKKQSAGRKDLVVGYVGAIVPYEGLDLLVKASSEVKKRIGDKGVRYVIVGDGSSKKLIEEIVDEEGVREQFEFTGKIPHEEIDEIYDRIDVVVIPRLSEKVCEIVPALKPLEAMKYGKLVVCSDVGPSEELIVDGENGFLFDKGSHESLADVLESIINNRDLLSIGKNSSEWVHENRQWSEMTEEAAKSCSRMMLPGILDSPTPETKSAIEIIRILLGGGDGSASETQKEFDLSLNYLEKPRDRKNSFLAFLRELGEINPDEGLIFGKENVEVFGDRRSIRSLITYANRTGEGEYGQTLLDKYSEELDKDFTKSQKASMGAMAKRDLARRQRLSEIPAWYKFDISNLGRGKRLEVSGMAFIERGDRIRAALGRFKFFDGNGDEIDESPSFLYNSNAVGYYNYLSPIENRFCIPFLPPESAESVEVGFQTWEREAVVAIHPDVNIDISSSEEMKGSLTEFAKYARESYGSDIVFMFSGTTFINEVRANRPIRLTRVMLERGNHVIFNYHRSNLREEIPKQENEELIQIPIDITTELIEEICEFDFGKSRKIFMISYPHPIVPKVLQRFKQNGWVVIYDARDDWEEFSMVGQASWYRSWAENYIVRNSDKSSAVSWPLAEKLSEYSIEKVSVVPNALSPNFKSPDFERKNTRSNLVGYFGHLTDSWFDWGSLILIANELPEFSFEIIGHSEPDDLKLPKNVILLGPKNHPEINQIACRWDAAIIPFKTGPLADAVDPIKIYEYLALGLPTVSFKMPQIDNYPITRTVTDVEEFKKELIWAVNLEVNYEEVDSWLQENTWERRVECYEEWYDIRELEND